MIIRGGENIFPAQIEDFLYTNPKIEHVEVCLSMKFYYNQLLPGGGGGTRGVRHTGVCALIGRFFGKNP